MKKLLTGFLSLFLVLTLIPVGVNAFAEEAKENKPIKATFKFVSYENNSNGEWVGETSFEVKEGDVITANHWANMKGMHHVDAKKYSDLTYDVIKAYMDPETSVGFVPVPVVKNDKDKINGTIVLKHADGYEKSFDVSLFPDEKIENSYVNPFLNGYYVPGEDNQELAGYSSFTKENNYTVILEVLKKVETEPETPNTIKLLVKFADYTSGKEVVLEQVQNFPEFVVGSALKIKDLDIPYPYECQVLGDEVSYKELKDNAKYDEKTDTYVVTLPVAKIKDHAIWGTIILTYNDVVVDKFTGIELTPETQLVMGDFMPSDKTLTYQGYEGPNSILAGYSSFTKENNYTVTFPLVKVDTEPEYIKLHINFVDYTSGVEVVLPNVQDFPEFVVGSALKIKDLDIPYPYECKVLGNEVSYKELMDNAKYDSETNTYNIKLPVEIPTINGTIVLMHEGKEVQRFENITVQKGQNLFMGDFMPKEPYFYEGYKGPMSILAGYSSFTEENNYTVTLEVKVSKFQMGYSVDEKYGEVEGGNYVSTKPVDKNLLLGKIYHLPEVKVVKGYKLVGWKVETLLNGVLTVESSIASDVKEVAIDQYLDSDAVLFTAVFEKEIEKFQVGYSVDENKGTVKGGSNFAQTGLKDKETFKGFTFGLPKVEAKKGYKFVGWKVETLLNNKIVVEKALSNTTKNVAIDQYLDSDAVMFTAIFDKVGEVNNPSKPSTPSKPVVQTPAAKPVVNTATK